MAIRFAHRPVHILFSLTLAITMLSLQAKAEAPTGSPGQGKRPKIALVLSGGGARGAAHVGVIKVLEEYRVPIDYIVGTSMGSLVGAAYASGTSVTDMEKLLGELSTNTLFRDAPPREELQIRRKQEDRSLLFSPEIGINSLGGNVLPKGMVSGVQLESVLRKITAPGFRDFDKLPIPYRAVATNLETGQEVIFDKGELANVMRASMSVPVAIAPTEIDGKLLVDGMLVNNLPVNVARAMGADIIIAVNVGTPLLKREELGSLLGVAGQMLSILTEQNVQAAIASLKTTDILISPELGDFATSDFDHLVKTLPIGEAAARKAADKLSRLSLPPEQYAIYRKNLSKLTEQDFRPVEKIRFENLKNVNPEYAQSLMETKPGKTIVQSEIDNDLRRIYGTGDFEHLNYKILEDHGQRILGIEAIEKSWGPNYFRSGIGLDSDFQGNANFTLQGRFRKNWLNSLGAEWVSDIQLGHVDRFASEFYQPIDMKHDYFVAPGLELKQNSTDIYADDNRIARYEMDRYRVGLDLGRNIEPYGQLRVGVRGGILNPSLAIGAPNLAPVEGNIAEGAFIARLELDKLDSVAFPQKGWLVNANLYNSNSALGADDTYTKWEMRGMYAYTIDRQHTFNIFGVANGTLDGTLPTYDQNQWGGFLRQSGYRTGQLTGESLTYGRFMYYNKLIDYEMFDGLYAGLSLELGKMDNPLIKSNSDELLRSGSVFLATDSPIGPLYFGYGLTEEGYHSFYLYLGLPYQ
ncbi:MAG: patatin-like phospholipase family protein [Desulfobulbaceae bacterium]|nr:patatin-like phospholipase family protein [Desulfobulbaceae bacterium]